MNEIRSEQNLFLSSPTFLVSLFPLYFRLYSLKCSCESARQKHIHTCKIIIQPSLKRVTRINKLVVGDAKKFVEKIYTPFSIGDVIIRSIPPCRKQKKREKRVVSELRRWEKKKTSKEEGKKLQFFYFQIYSCIILGRI